jgi:serine phosphatase RsbU (regulator of sigma subunit)
MEIQIAAAKVNKYATSESGDTIEVIERPNGGVSVVMADGQSSGRGAKTISSLAVRKVLALISDGVRDGAAARAASDAIFTERKGKVSATLNILSADMQTKTLVITRNNPAAMLVAHHETITCLSDESKPIGLYRDTRPSICEWPLEAGLTAVAYTDGLIHCGSRYGQRLDIELHLKVLLEDEQATPQRIADSLLNQAITLDQGRPVDDISIIVLRVSSFDGDNVRRLSVRLPLV